MVLKFLMQRSCTGHESLSSTGRRVWATRKLLVLPRSVTVHVCTHTAHTLHRPDCRRVYGRSENSLSCRDHRHDRWCIDGIEISEENQAICHEILEYRGVSNRNFSNLWWGFPGSFSGKKVRRVLFFSKFLAIQSGFLFLFPNFKKNPRVLVPFLFYFQDFIRGFYRGFLFLTFRGQLKVDRKFQINLLIHR